MTALSTTLSDSLNSFRTCTSQTWNQFSAFLVNKHKENPTLVKTSVYATAIFAGFCLSVLHLYATSSFLERVITDYNATRTIHVLGSDLEKFANMVITPYTMKLTIDSVVNNHLDKSFPVAVFVRNSLDISFMRSVEIHVALAVGLGASVGLISLFHAHVNKEEIQK